MLDLPCVPYPVQKSITSMRAARLHRIGNWRLHSVGRQTNAARIDDQLPLRKRDCAGNMTMPAEDDWLSNTGYAGFDCRSASQNDAGSFHLFEQVWRIEQITVANKQFI